MTTAIQPIIYENPLVNLAGDLFADAALEALSIATHELRAVTDRAFEAVLPETFERVSDESPRDSTVSGRLSRYLYREMTGTPHRADSPVVMGFVLDAGGGGLAMLNRAIVALKPSHVATLNDPHASERMRRLAAYATYHELLHILPLDTWSPMLWGLPHRQPLAAMALETATAYVPGASARAYRRFADNDYTDGRSLHPAEIHRIRSTPLLETVVAPPEVIEETEPIIVTATGADVRVLDAVIPFPLPDPESLETPRSLASTAARLALLPQLFTPGKITIDGVRVDRRDGYVTEVYELRRSLDRE